MSLIKVVKHLGGQKNYGIEFTKNPDEHSVARILSLTGEEVVGFATMSHKSNEQNLYIDRRLYDVEPLIPMSKQSFVIIISGERDSGKSTMGAMFINQYQGIFPNRAMYLISEKKKEIDRNFSRIDQLDQLEEDEILAFDINQYHDSLFVVDDSDFGKNAKAVFEILNIISSVGREYNISLIFITHFNSRLNVTKVYTEFQIYITFPNNLANNRMLNTHFGFNKHQIQGLIDLKASYYVFNRIYGALITDKRISKY